MPAASLALAKRVGANAVVVSEALRGRVAALQGRLIPPDIQVEVTRDYGHTADEKANEPLSPLGLATASIVVLIAIAIGWREALAAIIGAATILTDPIFQGLAISLLFGLASSTSLTVLAIPAVYAVLRDADRMAE